MGTRGGGVEGRWRCTPLLGSSRITVCTPTPQLDYWHKTIDIEIEGIAVEFADLWANGSNVPGDSWEMGSDVHTTDLFSLKAAEMVTNHTRWFGSGDDETRVRGGDAAAGVAASRRRFFLYYNLQNPHTPLESYIDGELSCPQRYFSECTLGGVYGFERRANCGLIRQLDDALRNLTGLLSALGHRNSTLLLMMSDNGGAITTGGFNNPLRGGKVSSFEGGVRSRTLLWGPGVLPNADGIEYRNCSGKIHVRVRFLPQ